MISEPLLYEPIQQKIGEEIGNTKEIISDLQINLDFLIHEPKRMAILLTLTKNPVITFSNLQKTICTTSGNLTKFVSLPSS